MRRLLIGWVGVTVVCGVLAAPAGATAAPAASATPVTSVTSGPQAAPGALPRPEVFSPDGTISRAPVAPNSQPQVSTLAMAPATVTPVELNGPSQNRIDIVFVGDGYVAAEQDVFASQVDSAWNLLASRAPYSTYRRLFNVWRVDIVSPVSGVSGDPTADVVRNTPLALGYWCSGVERLLCADTDAVHQYAALAPDVDEVGVLANSTKYGGAGYTDEEIATFAGGNEDAGEIFPHELGHALGDLADEYPYLVSPDENSTYTGREPTVANVTKRTAADMARTSTKWYRWLGASTPDGGTIGAFEGANTFAHGIFRPSEDSLMRDLGREFNAVSREKMIQSFYAIARPIDAVSPAGTSTGRRSTVSVTTIPLPVTTRWFLDGTEVTAWRNLTTVTLNASAANRTLTVRVSDPTTSVRDPNYIGTYLTQSRNWTLTNQSG